MVHVFYRITKAVDTHSEYVIIIAFPLRQWLRERTSMLRFTYFACRFEVRAGAMSLQPLKYRNLLWTNCGGVFECNAV
jgi:hypothetical protein